MTIRILSIAEIEAAEAALHYEERQSGLGDQFLTEFENALERIRRDPRFLGPMENYAGPHELRRCILHRFPYIVVFLVRSDEALIIAVSNARRRPMYWLDQLSHGDRS